MPRKQNTLGKSNQDGASRDRAPISNTPAESGGRREMAQGDTEIPEEIRVKANRALQRMFDVEKAAGR